MATATASRADDDRRRAIDLEGDDLAELEDRSLADELLDDLLPPEFDWRRVVRRYPIPALLVAATGGYLLGRAKGRALVGALVDLVADQVSDQVAHRVGALADEDLG